MPIIFAVRAPRYWLFGVVFLALNWLIAISPQAVHAQPSSAVKVVTAADIAFMQGMIGHHGQALEMTALIPSRSTFKTMALLGERITVSQRDEIAMMSEWLRLRGADAHRMTGHQMPGMLSPAQMDTLRAATGVRFDRLFLRYMIQHHDGALQMVKSLLGTNGAAQEPQLFGFASDVDTDQRAEIRRMQQLLKDLSTPTTKTRR
jgi:uncharacterized protein (DUF305 family)